MGTDQAAATTGTHWEKRRPRKDNRSMLNGMLWIVRSGAQWRELPEIYGPWQSVYTRFAKWRDDGTLERVFEVLSQDADGENPSIVSPASNTVSLPNKADNIITMVSISRKPENTDA